MECYSYLVHYSSMVPAEIPAPLEHRGSVEVWVHDATVVAVVHAQNVERLVGDYLGGIIATQPQRVNVKAVTRKSGSPPSPVSKVLRMNASIVAAIVYWMSHKPSSYPPFVLEGTGTWFPTISHIREMS